MTVDETPALNTFYATRFNFYAKMSYCIADITMQEIICLGVLSKSYYEKSLENLQENTRGRDLFSKQLF